MTTKLRKHYVTRIPRIVFRAHDSFSHAGNGSKRWKVAHAQWFSEMLLSV